MQKDRFDFRLIFIVLPVCLHGFFGHDCSEQCHQACIGCNHVNGSCVSGCKQGWKGDVCREGIFFYEMRFDIDKEHTFKCAPPFAFFFYSFVWVFLGFFSHKYIAIKLKTNICVDNVRIPTCIILLSYAWIISKFLLVAYCTKQ